MNEKSLRTLEFNKIKDLLASYAITALGEARCQSLLPVARLADVERMQTETEEALRVLTYRGDHPLIPFKDVSGQISLSEKGATLSIRALLDVAELLRAANVGHKALADDELERSPRLSALAARLVPLRSLEREITNAIISEEEISDNASAQLADIRRHIRLCNDRVRDKLQSMVHSASYAKYLQDAIITVRSGRYVLPVRQEYRQMVPGLVHDQSSSGATLYIEPMAVVEAGNELKEWEIKERLEIERILAHLSSQVAENADALYENLDILTEIDFRFAKASYAREISAIKPKLNDRGFIRFVQVRHPLIPRDVVVPCDLYLGDDFTTLIITGPNTGGKTVTLKTVGLISLMALSGLHVPGKLGTEVAVFEQVFADIGDEQSIEQSLSTFSSHMTNIVSILLEADRRDLVLFDELGAGTDPTEGAALAQAILEQMRAHQIRTIATTHYSELKAYALSTPGVQNASVEFDVSTLSPTYRLLIGVPGKSNAFEISKRLGLPQRLIESAQTLLSHEAVKFEDIIANAEVHRQAAEKERRLAEEAQEEIQQLRREAEKKYQEIAQERQNARQKARDEAKRILEKAKRESAAVLEELKALKTSDPNAVNRLRRRMRDAENELTESFPGLEIGESLNPDELSVGMPVLLGMNNASATLLSLPDAKNEVQVQAGAVKMRVSVDQLLPALQKREKKKTVVRTSTAAATRSVKMECDVRGMALDEAIVEVDNYLDSAVLAGYHEVSIIHGKGTGTLRSGLNDHLKRHPLLAGHRAGRYGEGEAGVTVVTLK
ncbi:MAG: endonuclease MutS2 [Christensenellales bacterium]|jgi:DNA mismatch repair protein MutS2